MRLSLLSRRQLLLAGGAAALPGLASAQAAPPRLISIGGALTELVYELGLQQLLVGVDSTSLFPAAATRLPQVGYARSLAAEGLLSLKPSLIVATEDAGPPAVLRQLEAARVPLHVLRAEHRFEGLLERCRQLGQLLQRQAAAQALIEGLEGRWRHSTAQVQLLRQQRKPLRVMFVLSHGMNQVRIAGQDTAADAMLGYAGAVNAIQGFTGYKLLTPEAAIAAAPEVLLFTDQGVAAAGGIQALLKLPGLAQTPAVRAQRVLSFEALELLGFGPRLPQAVLRLAQALYPAG